MIRTLNKLEIFLKNDGFSGHFPLEKGHYYHKEIFNIEIVIYFDNSSIFVLDKSNVETIYTYKTTEEAINYIIGETRKAKIKHLLNNGRG